MRKSWIVVGVLALLAAGALSLGALIASGATPFLFRRVRLLNASTTKITRLEVKSGTTVLWTLCPSGGVLPNGNADDHGEQEWSAAQAFGDVPSLDVHVWVWVGGQQKKLDPVSIVPTAGCFFKDLMVVVDDVPGTTTGDFEVAVIASCAADPAHPHQNVIKEEPRTPK